MNLIIPALRTLTAPLAFGALSVVASAQAPQERSFVPAPAAGHASFHAATGVLTRGEGAEQDKRISTLTSLDNTDTSGFYTPTGPGQSDEYLDWGVMPSTPDEIVTGFSFAYATSQLDTTAGGTGADLTVSFYDGALGLGQDRGLLPSASYSFTGLPGSSTGDRVSWIISVDLTGGLEICKPDGAFGFGFRGGGDDGQGVSATGPLLCFAGDGNGGPDSNGQVDLLDIYDPDVLTGSYNGSFFFGGPPNDFSSIYLEVEVADSVNSGQATQVTRNPENSLGVTNPIDYVSNDLVLGGSFSGTVDLTQTGHSMAVILGYASPLTFELSAGQVVLVNFADPAGELLSFGLAAGPIASFSSPIVKDTSVCGFVVYSQALGLVGAQPFELSNALDLTVGF